MQPVVTGKLWATFHLIHDEMYLKFIQLQTVIRKIEFLFHKHTQKRLQVYHDICNIIFIMK